MLRGEGRLMLSDINFGNDERKPRPQVKIIGGLVNRTQLMSRMSVLDKSLGTIHPGRNKVERAELRHRISEDYHQSKVNIWLAFFLVFIIF